MKLIEIRKYRIDIFKSGDYSEFKYRFHYLSGLNDWSHDNIYCDYRTHFFDFKLFKIGFSKFLREVRLFDPKKYEKYART